MIHPLIRQSEGEPLLDWLIRCLTRVSVRTISRMYIYVLTYCESFLSVTLTKLFVSHSPPLPIMGNISSSLVIVVVLSVHMVHSFHVPLVPVIIRSRGDSLCCPPWITHRYYSSSARTTSSCLFLDTGAGDGGTDVELEAGLVHLDTDKGRDSSISTNNSSISTVLLCEAVDQWLRVESLSSLVSQADMMSIIVELRQSEVTYQRIHPTFSRRFDAITGRMKAEKRSLRQILDSPKDEKKLLDFVETLDIGR